MFARLMKQIATYLAPPYFTRFLFDQLGMKYPAH